MGMTIWKKTSITCSGWFGLLCLLAATLSTGCDAGAPPHVANPTPAPTLPAASATTVSPASTPLPAAAAAVPATPTPLPIREVKFAGVSTATNVPSQVQVVFSLRDENGHAIVRPAEEIEESVKVFERGPGTDDWEEIDYTETSFFVHTGENIDLEVVFVLDFTNSMAQARLPDGSGGIQAMLAAFDSALAVLPSAHRIGAVEFHDRNAEPGVLSALTTDRNGIRGNVLRFSQSSFDPGSSRVWDSVVAGTGLFSTRQDNSRVVRALVFLSDGRDTSSVNDREAARRLARAQYVQLYALGVGEVFQEAELREMANSTGGGYYSARDFSLLQEQLQLLVNDLRGQYQLSYITLRRTGEYSVGVEVNLPEVGERGWMETAPFDVARFFGSDNQGVVVSDPPSLDPANRQATVFIRALHMPRNIDRIRFKPDTAKPLSVELVSRQNGGLLDGWTLNGPDAAGFYAAAASQPLEFGNFGLLFKLTIADVAEQGPIIPIEFDNTIYTGGKSLSHSTLFVDSPTSSPAGSSAAGRIAFRSSRDGNSEIYVMNADGSGITRLTNRPEPNFNPAWSPDGRRIAFTSDRDGNFEIHVMNADGSGITQLTNHPERDWLPAWSPDGRRIAFDSSRDGNRDIHVMNADGSGITRLTNRPELDSNPAWSPDGRRIAFHSSRDGNWEIYVMNADGSGITRLTNHPENDGSPAWSPDGRRIAFRSSRDGNVEIYVMNADGSGITRLTNHPENDGSPAWSPDGRRIAFRSSRDGNVEIYVMNADGSGLTRLTNNDRDDSFPSWTGQ